MHNLQCQRPRSELRGLVRAYAQRDVGPHDSDLVELIPARLEQTLEFQFGECFEVFHADGRHEMAPKVVIVGAYPRGGCTIALKKGVSSFAIFFQPAGFSRLFKVPLAHLSITSHDARAVLGESVSCLHIQLAEEWSFEGRVRLAENFLLKRELRLTYSRPGARFASPMSRTTMDWAGGTSKEDSRSTSALRQSSLPAWRGFRQPLIQRSISLSVGGSKSLTVSDTTIRCIWSMTFMSWRDLRRGFSSL
jgi:hypothetical protein